MTTTYGEGYHNAYNKGYEAGIADMKRQLYDQRIIGFWRCLLIGGVAATLGSLVTMMMR